MLLAKVFAWMVAVPEVFKAHLITHLVTQASTNGSLHKLYLILNQIAFNVKW
jgi:hypothetical protein